MPALNLANTEATGYVNIYDIDSDDDGIPDNIEGQPTTSYALPSGNDTDADGIDNTFDNFSGFGGDGIHIYDEDGDGMPDYMDTDSDNDGLLDIVEGNDFNLNREPDDDITLTGIDTDGDGLDDKFDNDNGSAKGTSAYMGNGGSISGDAFPGSITMVQHTALSGSGGCPTERDWRCLPYVLNCDVIFFNATLYDQQVQLDWTVLCRQDVDHFIVLRSTDKVSFEPVDNIAGRVVTNETADYRTLDVLNNVPSSIVYYRLQTVLKTGDVKLGNIITVRRDSKKDFVVQLFPNPVHDHLQLSVKSPSGMVVQVYILDGTGRAVKKYTEKLMRGVNNFVYNETRSLPNGLYYLQVHMGDRVVSQKFSVLR
jgi:hypothetical protein